jgi:hypothetical protein
MKKHVITTLFLGLLTPALAFAQSDFNGTWKINLNQSKLSTKPDVYLLQDGTFTCKTCVPEVVVKADGQDHTVTGHPYYNTSAVQVVDDHTVKTTNKKDGKVVLELQTVISSDGNTAMQTFKDSSATDAAPVTGKSTSTRVAKGPAGSHLISGSWRTKDIDNVSDNGLLFTYKVEGDTISMTTPTGQSFTAKLDGTEAPFMGDPGQTSVSMKKTGPDSIEETDKRDTKIISTSKLTVAPGGKTMSITVDDKLHNTHSTYAADKQ